MWTDRVLAALSLLTLVAFLSILVVFVRRIDLTVVVVVVIFMAGYDFYRELRKRAARDIGAGPTRHSENDTA